jgi:hypothetical protein
MKNLNGLISGMVACIVLGAFGAHGQSLAVSLTGTYSGGTAVAYAETTSDYATGYYYDLCTYISALGEEDDGTWDSYETSGNCGSTDAEVSWTFTPTGTTDFIQFAGEHDMEIQYLVYQIDEYCGSDPYACGDHWDAFEASVLGGDNPTGETSTYSGISYITGSYGGAFTGTLIPLVSLSTYTGRSVQESVTMTGPRADIPGQGGCWWPGNDGGYSQPSTSQMYDNYSIWGVTGLTYGADNISAGKVYGLYYQSKLNGTYNASSNPLGGQPSCLLFIQTQSMYINGCTEGAWHLYNGNPPNSNTFIIGNSYYTATRNGASGPAN